MVLARPKLFLRLLCGFLVVLPENLQQNLRFCTLRFVDAAVFLRVRFFFGCSAAEGALILRFPQKPAEVLVNVLGFSWPLFWDIFMHTRP